MKCIDEELIQKYIDGETDQQESDLIEKHIEACSECAERIAQQRALIAKVKGAIGLLTRSTDDVPEMEFQSVANKRKWLTVNKITTLLAAASVLLFVIFFTQKDKTTQEEILMSESYFVGEFDANRTATQQELTITVISPEGRVSEKIVE